MRPEKRYLPLPAVFRAPHAGARPAVGDRLLDVRSHMRPVLQAPHCRVHLARAGMSLKSWVMAQEGDSRPQGRRDHDLDTIVQGYVPA